MSKFINAVSRYMRKGIDYVTAGQRADTALGNNATAEGTNTAASGNDSHSEGDSTKAVGAAAHAEGYNTTASGDDAHAGGRNSYAIADQSFVHGEGVRCYTASGVAIGKFNSATSSDTGIAFQIGNGTSNSSRSNALTIDFNGNVNANGNTLIKEPPTTNGSWVYTYQNGTASWSALSVTGAPTWGSL